MKNLFASSLLFFCVVHPAFASPEFSVDFTPIVLENQDHALPAKTICFGNEWANVDASIQDKILALKTEAPEAFLIQGKETAGNCYALDQVPAGMQGDFDHVLNLIQQKTEGQVVMPASETILQAAPAEGKLILRNQNKPLYKKVLRSAAIVSISQVAEMGTLLLSPTSFSNWDSNPLRAAGPNIEYAWSHAPVPDHDSFVVNFVAHPYAGTFSYNLMRSQGAKPYQSFLFAAAESTFWEFVVEATCEKPSIQDLFSTPIIGSLAGELIHRGTIRLARGGFNGVEKAIVLILNPGYILNNGFKVKRAPIVNPLEN